MLHCNNVPRLVKNKDNIFTTEGISEQKILIFHQINERVSEANEWVYGEISIFLWTNDWRSENIIFILNHEWYIDIIPWHLEAFGSRYYLIQLVPPNFGKFYLEISKFSANSAPKTKLTFWISSFSPVSGIKRPGGLGWPREGKLEAKYYNLDK